MSRLISAFIIILLLGEAVVVSGMIVLMFHTFKHYWHGDGKLWDKDEFWEATSIIRQWREESLVWGHLAKLLGFWNTSDMLARWNQDTLNTMRMLSGPHGWTIYQAMLKKRNMK